MHALNITLDRCYVSSVLGNKVYISDTNGRCQLLMMCKWANEKQQKIRKSLQRNLSDCGKKSYDKQSFC